MTDRRDFIPGTCEREIAPGIVFRPIRSWHSNTYAGERLTQVNGDGSGCVKELAGRSMCNIPLTVTHRTYWNKITDKKVSSFLSYPDGMSAQEGYFWEIYPNSEGGISRFDSETEMEAEVVKLLTEAAQ